MDVGWIEFDVPWSNLVRMSRYVMHTDLNTIDYILLYFIFFPQLLVIICVLEWCFDNNCLKQVKKMILYAVSQAVKDISE